MSKLLDLAKEMQANNVLVVGIGYLSVIFVRIETAGGTNQVVGGTWLNHELKSLQ